MLHFSPTEKRMYRQNPGHVTSQGHPFSRKDWDKEVFVFVLLVKILGTNCSLTDVLTLVPKLTY